jgi:hypothetical protein
LFHVRSPLLDRSTSADAASLTARTAAENDTSARQPDQSPHNTQGYLFDAVVRHPVTAVG